MTNITYCVVSGVLFVLVALVHLLRLVYQLPVVVDEYVVPMWASWVACIVPALLAVWAFRLASVSR